MEFMDGRANVRTMVLFIFLNFDVWSGGINSQTMRMELQFLQEFSLCRDKNSEERTKSGQNDRRKRLIRS